MRPSYLLESSAADVGVKPYICRRSMPMVEWKALSRLKHHKNSHLDAPPGSVGFFTREELLFHSVNCLL